MLCQIQIYILSVQIYSFIFIYPSWHCSPSPVSKKRHKTSKQTTGRGRSLASKFSKHRDESRVQPKSKHSSLVAPKSPMLTPALRQIMSSPGPEGAPGLDHSTTVTRDHLGIHRIRGVCGRDLQSLSVMVSLALQEIMPQVQADRGSRVLLVQ